MNYAMYWTARGDKVEETIAGFKQTGGVPPHGVKIIERWHHVGERSGISIVESNDPVAVGRFARAWADLMDIEVRQVLTDEEAAKALFT